MKKYHLPILLAVIISGCVSYGGNTRSDFSPLGSVECDQKANEFYLFMENEETDFEYKRIGLIDVQGGEYVDLTEVMNELKHQGWQNCANAIINVSQSNTIRESGTAFVDETQELYSSKVMTGMAVKVELTESFRSRYSQNKVPIDFVAEVDQRKAQESKSANTEVTASIIVGIVGLIVLIAAA